MRSQHWKRCQLVYRSMGMQVPLQPTSLSFQVAVESLLLKSYFSCSIYLTLFYYYLSRRSHMAKLKAEFNTVLLPIQRSELGLASKGESSRRILSMLRANKVRVILRFWEKLINIKSLSHFCNIVFIEWMYAFWMQIEIVFPFSLLLDDITACWVQYNVVFLSKSRFVSNLLPHLNAYTLLNFGFLGHFLF